MVRLTDRDLAISDTQIEIIANDQLIDHQEIERPHDERHYQMSNCQLYFPPSFVSEGHSFQINVYNPLTSVWVTCSVDRQQSFIPRWARRPDGTKRAHIAAKIGRPCWKGKTVEITGMEDCVERCPEGFNFQGKQFALEKTQSVFEMAADEFPDLNEAQKAEKVNQKVEEKLAAAGGAEKDGEMLGGFITVRIFEIDSFHVKYRSQEGGYFKEERPLQTADISVGGAATVPGNDFQQISRVTSREGNLKHKPGRLLFVKIIRYGLEQHKDEKKMAFDVIADAVDREIREEKMILKGQGKKGKGKKSKGKGKGKNEQDDDGAAVGNNASSKSTTSKTSVAAADGNIPPLSEILKALNGGIISAKFHKKADGKERDIRCTCAQDKIPEDQWPDSGFPAKHPVRKWNEQQVNVYDLGIKQWRSFIYEKLIEVTIESGSAGSNGQKSKKQKAAGGGKGKGKARRRMKEGVDH
jgi:hypothetical protein